MVALLAVQAFLPYAAAKVADYLQRANWSNPDSARKGAPIGKKLKYIIARLFYLAVQLSRLAELVNFLGFMSDAPLKAGTSFKRNLSETFL